MFFFSQNIGFVLLIVRIELSAVKAIEQNVICLWPLASKKI